MALGMDFWNFASASDACESADWMSLCSVDDTFSGVLGLELFVENTGAFTSLIST